MKRIASLSCLLAAAMLTAQTAPTTTTAPKAPAAAAKSAATATAKTSTTATASTAAGYKLPTGEKRIPGIPKTAFTLKYQDIKIGAGEEGEPGKLWHVNYKGWRAADGIVFDSSDDHKRPVIGKDGKPEMGPDGKPKMGEAEPLAFPEGMGRLIPGFDYGVMGMRIGGKRRIFIPWQMAYGTRNIPDRPDHPGIPAKSDLIFDVELVQVTDMPQPPARPMMPPRPAPGTTPGAAPGAPGTPGAAPKPAAPGTPGAPSTPPPASTPGTTPPPSAAPGNPGAPGSTPPPAGTTANPSTQSAPPTSEPAKPTPPPQPK